MLVWLNLKPVWLGSGARGRWRGEGKRKGKRREREGREVEGREEEGGERKEEEDEWVGKGLRVEEGEGRKAERGIEGGKVER